MALSLPSALEALLFAHGDALPKKRLLSLLGATPEMLEAAVAELRADLTSRGLSILETEEELELRTSPEAAPLVEKLREAERTRDLGKASLETLSIILYQGGATRGEVDYVRGVNSTAALRVLLLRGLIERTEDQSDKRRARYTATIDALAHLGVSRVKDLPRYEEFVGALGAKRDALDAA